MANNEKDSKTECYPQRPMPPKSEVTTAKDKPGCAKECAKKQVGDSGNII